MLDIAFVEDQIFGNSIKLNKFILFYKEHQNILTAMHDQDRSVILHIGPRQVMLLLDPLNINTIVI